MNEYGKARGVDIVGQLRWCLNRIYHMNRWSKIKKVPDETGVISKIQIETFKDEEINDEVHHFEHYGFHAVPDVLCDVITLNLAGNNHHPAIIASNDQRYKPKNMKTGETQIYDNKNQVVYLQNGTEIIITAVSGITLNCPGGTLVHDNLSTKGNLAAGTGASGVFTTQTGKVVTVKDGIIIEIA